MNKHQAYLLKLMREIHDICVANDIKYSIYAGTLIGAARNRGFLPWDDDADVLMTYDNWLRFKEVCKTQLPENRFLGSADTEESYGHLLPRYVSRDTTSIHTAQSLHDDVAGVVIDIFVLDPIADGEEAYQAYMQDLYLYTSLINYANCSGTKVGVDAELFKQYLDRIHNGEKLAVAREMEERIASHFDEAGSRYALRWQGLPLTFERKWFEEVVYMEFEGLDFMAPKGVNELLTCYYGEEWTDIPGAIDPAKHNCAFSLKFPYTEALEQFTPKYDRAQLLADTEERRMLTLDLASINNRIRDERASARGFVVTQEALRRIEEHRDEFDKAYAEEDVCMLEALLGEYLQWQTSAEMVGRHADKAAYRYLHPLLIPVPDDVFVSMLFVLMARRRISMASRMLELRRQAGLPVQGKMLEVEEGLENLRSSMNDYQYGRFDEGLQKANGLVERFPYVAYFLKLQCFHLWKLYSEQPTEENGAAFVAAYQTGLERFPGDGFFEKMKADWLYNAGETEQAQILYLQAAERTRNGLAIQDIFDKTGYYPSWLRNPDWAHEAGVPQWDGPEPSLDGLPKPKASSAPAMPDERRECLLRLLDEVVGACARVGAPYVLGPGIAWALSERGTVPVNVEDYLVICRPDDMVRIVGALEGNSKDRHIESIWSGASLKRVGYSVRYHDKHSLMLDMGAKSKPPQTSLFVTLAPLESKEHSRLSAKMIEQAFLPPKQGRVARRLLKRHPSNMRRCYASVMKESAKSAPEYYYSRGAYVHCGKLDCTDAKPVEIDGHEYLVPTDLNAYVSACLEDFPQVDEPLKPQYLQSGVVSYDELIASGALSNEYFALRKSVFEPNKRGNEILARFRDNFADIKKAVALKDKSYGKEAQS